MEDNHSQEKTIVDERTHQMQIEASQFLIDQIIFWFDNNPFLTLEEQLALIYEIRTVLDDAEKRLHTDPNRLFHAEGHEERMKDLPRQIQLGIERLGSTSES